MSDILFCVTPTPGHVNPLLLIATHLRTHGHSVLFQSSGVFQEVVEAAGLEFTTLERLANHDYRESKSIWPELETAKPGIGQLNAYMKVIASLIPEQHSSLERIMENRSIDLIVTDYLFLGTFPMLLDISRKRPPLVTMGVTPVLLRTSGVSPLAGPDDSAAGLERNTEHNRIFGDLLKPGTDYVDAILSRLGVHIQGGFTWDSLYTIPDTFLQLSAEEFEYPLRERPSNFRFVGPVVPSKETRTELPIWFDDLDHSKPVVFVSQGGVANTDFSELVGPALEGLAELEVELVVTGGSRDIGDLAGKENAHVERYLPYGLILPKASIFITNGGFTGVQQALGYGVPVIAAGSTEEKPLVAARVAWSGAGIDLQTGKPSSEQIRAAVLRVLSEPTFKLRARELEASFRRYDALRSVEDTVNAIISKAARA